MTDATWRPTRSATVAFTVLSWLLGWSLSIPAAHAQPDAPLVKTRQGRLQGVREGKLRVFRGVAYAQPPVGPLRFRPPQPLKRQSGLVLAREFGSKALQAGGAGAVQGSEDCLYLNVWAPEIARRKKLPVVVWVHGGAFTGGSGQDNDTWTFAAQDTVIAVSFNYRLGSLGFLQLGQRLGNDYSQAGNAGILDAVAALRWVHQNIAAFGGDPKRVTVMGESAGAKLIGGLLVTPAAEGLFQQVILESGAVQAVRDTATAGATTKQLLQALHLTNPQELLTLPAESLVQAQTAFTNGAGGLQVFGPVLDGTTIPTPPLDYVRQHAKRPLRVLLGTNREEARLFSGPGSVIHEPNEAALQQVFGPKNSPYVWQAYQKLSQTQPPLEAWNSVLTDYLYRLATYRLAQTLAEQGTPTWLYRFDYSSPTFRPMHAQELAFVWNAPAGSSAAATAAAPATAPSKAADPALAARMHAYWAQFIKTGQPGPQWPTYTPEKREAMIFDANSRLEPLPAPYEDPAFPVQGYGW
ncbi:carboxylesterase/lipase family protein [Hymenobacter wooponensis]|uniref:Carboxylic ester hydrolase n=1 Tax=Hymenobacter wooponensis TaxID=1525360 RepID=A0A4Z0MHH7_9BACT|nr:carboxylesterase family protein [Hymenobacter wooponensis]TGD78787.1 carboxylesterase/lipase family protein [Hymenobacter wooponensis]